MDKNQELNPPNQPTGMVRDGLYVGNVAIISTEREKTEPVVNRYKDEKGNDTTAATFDWIEWGENDTYPDIVDDQNSKEPVSSRCLEFKTKANVGSGLFWFRKEFADGKEYHIPVDINDYPDIRDFCKRSNIDRTMMELSMDFEWWQLCHTEMIKNATGDKFHSMSRIDTAFCRAGARNKKGKIDKIYISSKFGLRKGISPDDLQEVSTLDINDPLKYNKSILRHGFMTTRRLYYPKPSWHSVFSWVDTMLEVSKWISSNLRNSANIKYLIKVPWNYFLSRFKLEDYNGDRNAWIEAIKTDEARLYKEMDDMLCGTDNVNKTFKTKYGKDENGDEIEGFEIKPLENKLNHDAFLPAYDTGAAAICSGHGVAPVLASIQISSGMGASHGSTIREYFNFFTQFETVKSRQCILEPLLLVKEVNGWPADIYPGFRNIILETLDHNKSGSRTEGEGNPTTSNKES